MKNKYDRHGEFLKMTVDEDKNIKIVGFKSNAIQQEVSKIINVCQTLKVPLNWDNIIDFVNSKELCQLRDVVEGSNEWIKINMNFKLTMPDSTILQIQRVQNKKVWQAFQMEAERLASKLGGIANVNITEMYHGTGTTNPELIYKSEQGFDISFS